MKGGISLFLSDEFESKLWSSKSNGHEVIGAGASIVSSSYSLFSLVGKSFKASQRKKAKT